MKALLRWFIRALLVVAVALALAWVLAPREPVDLAERFDAGRIGADPAAYFAAEEARFDDITPGVEKRIRWIGAPGANSDIVVLYAHGFSATSEEIRPVPDRVAETLGANLVWMRLAGHGRGGAAMAEPQVADWVADFDEALAVADRIGERVLVIGTSTGATLAAALLAEGRDARIDAAVFVSPNFRIANPAAAVLTLPGARHWVPPLFGQERAFEPLNEDHARYWTTRYPTRALFPMAALVEHAVAADFGAVETPALFVFSDADGVVDHRATREIAVAWGGPATVEAVETGPGNDPYAHVIAGDILSPGMTDEVARLITGWAETVLP